MSRLTLSWPASISLHLRYAKRAVQHLHILDVRIDMGERANIERLHIRRSSTCDAGRGKFEVAGNRTEGGT